MNTSLVDYGIQNDESDLRVHIGVAARHAFAFPTAHARELIARNGSYLQRTASQRGIVTGRGVTIPVSAFQHIEIVAIPPDIYQMADWNLRMDESEKGSAATLTAQLMFHRHLFHLPFDLDVAEVDGQELQIKGLDMLIAVRSRLKIQVKCDWKAGGERVELSSSAVRWRGNLFLQTQERNPFRKY